MCHTMAATASVLLILSISAVPAAAAPFPSGTDKPDGRVGGMLRSWSSPFAGSYGVAYDVRPRIEPDTADLAWVQPEATIPPDPPFPVGAADFQDWIGTGNPVAEPL